MPKLQLQRAPTQPNTSNSVPYFRKGKKNQGLTDFANYMGGQLQGAGFAPKQLQQQILGYYQNPTQAAQGFLPYFQNAISASAAPMLRQAGQDRMRLSANVASRFGGNVSSEEFRQTNQFDDYVARAISEQAAQAGPAALAAASQNAYGATAAYGQFAGQEAQLRNQILASIAGQTKDPNFFGQLLGTAVGVGAKFIPGL
ncbi:MAG: hypothetical protein AMS20_00070 [Gemmatimonas sp. SG8_28]|nr:MAG: hypothetical protein AMS20_00070 [Gemmatimonas sp. SG8_28]